MIKLLLIPIFTVAFHLQSRAQSDSLVGLIPSTTGEIPHNNPDNACILPVQPEYEFPGGQDSLKVYFYSRIEELDLPATIFYLEFKISEDGSVSEPRVLRSSALSEANIKAVEQIILEMPNWIPPQDKALQPVVYHFPIRIKQP
ncbi:MAG: hypothetical protein HWE14_05295 [Flavobacteriia bacterium]|nr:hypothetical protein [Flavobacteriia bacterium]